MGALALGVAACGADPSAEATSEDSAAITDPNDTSPIDPPDGLEVENATADQVTINFFCAAHATNHKIFRKADGGPTTQVATLAACQVPFVHPFTDSTVEPGRNNCYWIVASNSEHSAASQMLCTTVPLDLRVPALPNNPTLTNIGTNHATLSFTDASNNEAGFRIYLSDSGGPWRLYTTIDRGTRSHHPTGERLSVELTGLTTNTGYLVKIQVYHDFAPLSDERVLPELDTLPSPPTAPGNVRVTGVSDNSVSLAWNAGQGVDHYEVDQTEGISNGSTNVGNVLTFTKQSRLPNVHYCYRVISVNRGGTASSPEVCATTSGAGNQTFDVLVALNPSGLYQAPFGPITGGVLNSLELRGAANAPSLTAFDFVPQAVTDPAACDDTSKRVRVNRGSSVSGTDLAKLYGSATPSLNGPLLIHGCTVPRGIGNPFVTAHFSSPVATIAPPAPADAQVRSSASLDGGITLEWSDVDGEDAYLIQQVNGGDVPVIWAAANTTSQIISHLQPQTTYCFIVIARNSAGSGNSSKLCATTSNLPSE